MSSIADESELPLITIEIASDLSEMHKPEDVILQETRQCGFSEEAIFAIKLTLEEAVTNSIKHGNKCDPNKKVTVRYFVDERQVVIFVRDEGPGFNPEAVPDPTSPDRLSLPNGRGILLMRAYMDGVEYRENGREICFLKRKS